MCRIHTVAGALALALMAPRALVIHPRKGENQAQRDLEGSGDTVG
jgi:hypothetical protein